jgi:DNA-binding beta-propeller fold protein YncE
MQSLLVSEDNPMNMTKSLMIIIALTLSVLIISSCNGKDNLTIATPTIIVSPITDNRITPSPAELSPTPVKSILPTSVPTVSSLRTEMPVAKATSITKSLSTPIIAIPASTASTLLYESYESLTSWGKKGTGNGEFLSPCSIAVDSDTYVYVADCDNNRIQKFDSYGNFITKWGSKGKEKGQFTPVGIAVSPEGHVFIADNYYNRIQIFDSSGQFINMWRDEGISEEICGRINIHELAVDFDENVYIPDTENGNSIHKFDSNGKFIKEFLSRIFLSVSFSYGRIVIDQEGYIYVVHSSHSSDGSAFNNASHDFCIQKFDSTGKFVREWGSEGNKDGQFSSIVGLAIDSKGYIYTADPAAQRIQKFDSSGNFITRWGSEKPGDGKFKPTGIAVDSEGNVYTVDRSNNCIQKVRLKSDFN